jgi:nucleoside-triphosphatase
MTAAQPVNKPRRLFLTGEPGCGKTTVVKATAELLTFRGLKVGGMTSSEMRESGIRIGFGIEDLMTHEHGELAKSTAGNGPRVGRYVVNLMDLERIGAGAINRAIHAAQVIIIDELGPMELHSLRFIESVNASLSSDRHILATIHKRARHPLVMLVKSNPKFEILEVTHENRDELPDLLAKRILAAK